MNIYDNKRIAVLRGYPQLIDGETSSVEEMYKWGLRNNVEVHSFYFSPMWKRKMPVYDNGYDHSHTVFNREMTNEILEELNKFDRVIVINPAKQFTGIKAPDIIAFHEMYKKIEPVKVWMQLNHQSKATEGTPFCWSYVNESDAVINLTLDGWFIDDVVNKIPGKKDKVIHTNLWSNVSSNEERYLNTKREKDVTYIGRFVVYKGAEDLLNIAEALIHNDLTPVIYGMDNSIGCKMKILEHKNTINLVQNKESDDLPGIVKVFGKLPHKEVIDKFNKSLFAWTIVNIKNDKDRSCFGNKLEVSMQEAIMSGSICIVNKKWAEEMKTEDGRRYIDIPNFIIPIDHQSPRPAIERMIEISNNPDLQEEYRKNAYEILKDEYDSNTVLPDLFNNLMLIQKDSEKIEGTKELVKCMTGSDKFADKFEELYEDGVLVPMVPRFMNKNSIHVFGGKSGKAMVKVELEEL